MQNICLLGASGSVGESTLKVLNIFKNDFSLFSFSVNENIERAKSIIQEFSPKYAVVSSEKIDRKILKEKYLSTEILYGKEGLSEIVKQKEVDTVVTAIVGASGILPTVEAIKSGKKIAIANKETLVTFGPYINELLKKYNTSLIPVDSEHNALFQLLENHSRENIRSITLTASGGSFRNLPIEKLKSVTVEETLNHPTWKMGAKITVDSAGLINKGLEVIEAHFLFGFPYENIEVVIHPESIIHGFMETIDGSVFGYASEPDMIFPVAHSLFYPKKTPRLLKERKPFTWRVLNFHEPDRSRYPALDMAYKVGKIGGTAPGIFNAANEEAVSGFLDRKIGFTQIPELIDFALNAIPVRNTLELEEYLDSDRYSREIVRKRIGQGK
ncbi:MAG: 1-deoxy-D-xylulose-5-phosphate reductoisomerase [Leptospiraceae bacterium]|nr:1-deoxy-D-xylulose-5-phosphate reductoisomerase [Leptospiraceae bacterium]MCK6380102.1 1-deoxy-D-xylulose-5-phosphate reductoisomerase [Leptospiraceae bacterium]NUM40525.1 1-deoxy-D-xylulose-5-phosphate reductoisomerase [Leptospiraceae bacterium]